ncbi:hypothetical protein ATANTOWER_010966 [Ataeniobius toweri]|uniref:Uncharacterized protein n=1 Tax=Ataeniobius toweri TaxID=208326 RepID=A0ABU7AQP9_9TELE|nr:hypothetical protein [Ataeniobius toweri]
MRNKVNINPFGEGSRSISKALDSREPQSEPGNSGEPIQGTRITPRADQLLIQEFREEPRTTSKALLASLPQLRSEVMIQQSERETGLKWAPWESSKARTTDDPKVHKDLSDI